jgi:hypothetical protein
MALSNYEKQKRWREKHRALYNLQQRNRRRKGGDATSNTHSIVNVGTARIDQPPRLSEAAPEVRSLGAAGFTTKKVGEFRMLVLPEQPINESTMPATKPRVFINEITGQPCSESVWNEIQKRKSEAKEKNYDLDPYIQA